MLVLCVHVPLLVYMCILGIFISLQNPEWYCIPVLPLHTRVTSSKDPVLQISFSKALNQLILRKRGEGVLNFVRRIMVYFHEDSLSLNWILNILTRDKCLKQMAEKEEQRLKGQNNVGVFFLPNNWSKIFVPTHSSCCDLHSRTKSLFF